MASVFDFNIFTIFSSKVKHRTISCEPLGSSKGLEYIAQIYHCRLLLQIFQDFENSKCLGNNKRLNNLQYFTHECGEINRVSRYWPV